MVTPPPFHQVEDPVFLEPEFSAQLTGGYDTSQVFSCDFLEPHTLPSLPNWKPFIPTSNLPVAKPVAYPTSPSGATYNLPKLPREVGDYLFARTLLPPSYMDVLDEEDPEESLKRHMSELRVVLGAAKTELKEAYVQAVRTEEEYAATVAEHHKGLSRWKKAKWAIPAAPAAPEDSEVWHDVVQARVARDKEDAKKKRTAKEVFGGNLLTFV